MCSDPDIDWHAHMAVCWPTATAEWGQRRLRELHKDDKVADGSLSDTDGVTIFSSILPPTPEADPFA